MGYGLLDEPELPVQPANAELDRSIEAIEVPIPRPTPEALTGRRTRRRSLIAISAATCGVLLVTWLSVELFAAHRLLGTLAARIDQIAVGKPDHALPELRDVQVEYGWTYGGTRAQELEQKILAARLQEVRGLLSTEQPARAVAELLSLQAVLTDKTDLAKVEALRQRSVAELPAAALFGKINVAHPARRDLAEFDRLARVELLPFLLERVDRPQGVLPHARERVLEVLRRLNDPRAVPKVVGVYLNSADPKVRVVAGEVLRAAGKKGGVAAVAGVGAALGQLREARDADGAGHDAVTRAERARRALDWLVGAGIEPAGKPSR